MSRTLTPEQQQLAQELAQLIEVDAAAIIQEIAEILATTPDEQLFGDTEFLLRDRVLRILGRALNARLAQKKRSCWRQRRVHQVRASRPLPRLPVAQPRELGRHRPLRACLLLLPLLWRGLRALG